MSILDCNEESLVKVLIKNVILEYYQKFVSKPIKVNYVEVNDVDIEQLSIEDCNEMLTNSHKYTVYFKYLSHTWDLNIYIYSKSPKRLLKPLGIKGGYHTLKEFIEHKMIGTWKLRS